MEDEAWFAPNEGANVNAGWLEKWELTVHSSTTAMQSERAVLWYDQCTWCPTSYTARRSLGSQAPEAFAAHM